MMIRQAATRRQDFKDPATQQGAIGETRHRDWQTRRVGEERKRQGRRESRGEARSVTGCIVVVDAGARGMPLGGAVAKVGSSALR